MFYKNNCSAKTCSGISVSAITVKNLEKYVWRSSFSVKLQAYSQKLHQKINSFTRTFQGFRLQVQNRYFAEHPWMAVSMSITFLLIFRNRYIPEHFSVAALVYICSRVFRSFCIFFSICLEYKDQYLIYD